MKLIKIEVKVPACEICEKEISSSERCFSIEEEILAGEGEIIKYNFHKECVDKLLIETAKELK